MKVRTKIYTTEISQFKIFYCNILVLIEIINPIVLYCIVVGSRRLMPPDALQPKAYCTNPGL